MRELLGVGHAIELGQIVRNGEGEGALPAVEGAQVEIVQVDAVFRCGFHGAQVVAAQAAGLGRAQHAGVAGMSLTLPRESLLAVAGVALADGVMKKTEAERLTTCPATSFDRSGRPVGALLATLSVTQF